MITSVEEMIGQYLSAWNSKKSEQYAPAFALCWDEQGTYSDPFFSAPNLNSLVKLAEDSLVTHGHRTFSIIRQVQAHHLTCFYVWRVDFPDGRNKEGYDFIEYSDEYKIIRLVSFY